MTMIPIKMEAITSQNWRATLPLGVTAQQQPFVAGYTPIALVVLAKAYVRPQGWRYFPFAFVHEEQVIGLALLAYAPATPHHYWLFHFFIDQAYQGLGYGTAALAQIGTYLQATEPACHSLYLTVHPQNTGAQRLYLRHGFQPTGDLLDGEPVYRRFFSAE